MGVLVSVGEFAISSGDMFMWKSERAEVVLIDSEDGWLVRHSTVGRLLGPPQVLHQARHRDAKLATWDVMARVQNATKNEVEMVRAGLGLGWHSTLLVAPLLARGELVEVLAPFRDPTWAPVYAVMLPERDRLPRIRAVVDFLAEALASTTTVA